MQIAAKTGIWRGNMSDPTIKQLLNNELEELVIPASFNGARFPVFFSTWATKLKRIIQEGYPETSSFGLSVYTTQQLALPNVEEVICRMDINYCNGKRNLRIAHGTQITANNYDFYQCGIDAPSTDIYAHEESSDSILGKIKSNWEKHIVFHGNDGNRVVYDTVSAAWVIEPDVASAPVSSRGGAKCLIQRRSYRRSARPSARFCAHSHRWEVAA